MSVVPQSCLPQLLPWLRKSLPKSFKLYRHLKSAIAGTWPGTEFIVDKWPEPTAVVEIPDTKPDTKCPCKDYYDNVVLGVYGDSDQALAELLKTPGVITWNKQLIFCAVADTFFPVIAKTAEEKGGKCDTVDGQWLLKATPEDIKPLPVPDGMKLVSVTEDMTETVSSTWKFTAKGSEDYIKALVRQFPSAALLTESGQHVGHMIGQTIGTMGLLYVQPAFRRKGLAKVIVTNLAQKYFDLGEDAYVVIEWHNEPSLKLHQSLGFKPVPDVRIAWINYSPPKCCAADVKKKCCV